ncbi:MAG: alpha/beta hydrolase family protein [Chitinophagaceae bacterium]
MAFRNYEIRSSENKPISIDIHIPQKSAQKVPFIIFSHGFKGFKDWGTFNMIADWFAEKGFGFVKFNFSHNGVTSQSPLEFTDLDAFGNNTFSKEMDDLGSVIDFVLTEPFLTENKLNSEKMYLVGHSRGGSISVLKTAEDKRVKKLVTWGAVNDLGKSWTPDFVKKWKKEGQIVVLNSRTGQQMPVNYSLYEDYQRHLDRLYVQAAVIKMNIPFLIIHGRNDETVGVSEAYEINDWNKECTEIYIVEDANHVFGAKHPWETGTLPNQTKEVLHKTLNFLLN